MKPPILLDFPESFETERLLIRCPLPGDGHELHAAVRESIENSRLDAVAEGAQDGRGLGGERTKGAGSFLTAFRAQAAPLPERDGDHGGKQRVARYRLGGTEVRDRLLVPHQFHGSRLHYRGGARHHGLRLRGPRGQTRRDPVRLTQSSQRESRPACRLLLEGKLQQQRGRHRRRTERHLDLRLDLC